MKQVMRRLCAGFCSLTLLGSLLWASAAAPAPVHATAWLKDVYVDGQNAEFANAQGQYTYLFSCNGTIYMPANTAASWLGCQLTVDQTARTAAFTSGGEAHVPGPNSTLPFEVDTDGARLDRYFDQGVDVQPLTDFTVTVDGAPWTFQSGGAPLYPFFVDGTLYLPLRSVGERMGKDVIWLPTPTEPHYCEEMISIDTPSTPEQRAEMQSYVDQCFQLYWKAAALVKELADAGNMTAQQAVDKLTQIETTLKQIGDLPTPSHTFLNKYNIQGIARSSTPYLDFDESIQSLQSGSSTFQELKAKGLPDYLNATLQGRYRNINDAQLALKVLAAAKGGV